MAEKTELPKQEFEIHIPITIQTSESVNLKVLKPILNDPKLINRIRDVVLSGIPLARERAGMAEKTECEVGPVAIAPKGQHTRTLRISGG